MVGSHSNIVCATLAYATATLSCDTGTCGPNMNTGDYNYSYVRAYLPEEPLCNIDANLALSLAQIAFLKEHVHSRRPPSPFGALPEHNRRKLIFQPCWRSTRWKSLT
jgi:hypothetical protein